MLSFLHLVLDELGLAHHSLLVLRQFKTRFGGGFRRHCYRCNWILTSRIVFNDRTNLSIDSARVILVLAERLTFFAINFTNLNLDLAELLLIFLEGGFFFALRMISTHALADRLDLDRVFVIFFTIAAHTTMTVVGHASVTSDIWHKGRGRLVLSIRFFRRSRIELSLTGLALHTVLRLQPSSDFLEFSLLLL